MKIRGFGNCQRTLPEVINGVMDDYSAWLKSNPSIKVLLMDTALTEVMYSRGDNEKMADYYTYVLTIGYEDAADDRVD